MGGIGGMNGSGGPAGAPSTAADFNQTDVMFTQMMIPHHDDAIAMSQVLLERPDLDPVVASLARGIEESQTEENAEMAGWLSQRGFDNPGIGSMMGGGAPEPADGATTAELETTFLNEMISHHAHGVTMAQNEVDGGASSKITEMAQTMVDVQSAEIETMNEMLDQA